MLTGSSAREDIHKLSIWQVYEVGKGNAFCTPMLAALTANVSARHQGATMKSILDPSFKYTRSSDTDLRKTFARIRRERSKQQRQQAEPTSTSVVQLQRRHSA